MNGSVIKDAVLAFLETRTMFSLPIANRQCRLLSKRDWTARTVLLALSLSQMGMSMAQRGPESAQRPSEKDRPVSDSHSFMELFTKLEDGIVLSVQERDEASLDRILAPEFLVRTAENPKQPVSKADWLKHQLARKGIRSFSPQTMAIRAYLGVAVVSFVETDQEMIGGKARSFSYFVIDLWEVNHDKWQVAARYVSEAQSAPAGDHQVKK